MWQSVLKTHASSSPSLPPKKLNVMGPFFLKQMCRHHSFLEGGRERVDRKEIATGFTTTATLFLSFLLRVELNFHFSPSPGFGRFSTKDSSSSSFFASQIAQLAQKKRVQKGGREEGAQCFEQHLRNASWLGSQFWGLMDGERGGEWV